MHPMQVFSERGDRQEMVETAEESFLERLTAPVESPLPLPQVLFVLAHPDDEVLAVGGRLERMTQSKLITVTDGAPLSGDDARHHGFPDLAAYRKARQAELLAALQDAGLDETFLLPFPAQTADQAASAHLKELTRAVAEAIERFHPEAVLTHPYEGGHPDHDACAFAAHNAVRLVQARHPTLQPPLLVEAPFYNVGDNGSMRTGNFLAPSNRALACAVLTKSEADRKRTRLGLFASQAETLAQFGTGQEQFRIAPKYDFTQPPHRGKLLYEHFPWGMTGDDFQRRAAEALNALFPNQRQPAATGTPKA